MRDPDSHLRDEAVFHSLLNEVEPIGREGAFNATELSADDAEKLQKLRCSLEMLNRAGNSKLPATVQGDQQYSSGPIAARSEKLSTRYTIIRTLGTGGFGIVVLAYDQQLKCYVAIKTPRPDILLTQSLVRRFLREAQNTAILNHPNIVPILGTDEGSIVPCIIYHYCDGPTLAEWMQKCNKPIPTRTVATIAKLLSIALQHAHNRGVIHRDIKPSNILLELGKEDKQSFGFQDKEQLWVPRISDFGISKIIEDIDNATHHTVAILGTPEYMAPEQAAGRADDVGTHSDVYSLGVVIFELLTGKPPFTKDEALKRAHADGDVLQLPSLRKQRTISLRT